MTQALISTLNTMPALINNEETGELRTNSTLRHEEWKVYDDALVEETQSRTQFLGYCVSKGFINTGDLGDITYNYEKISDFVDPQISMHGDSDFEKGRVVYSETGVSVPLVHTHWNVNARSLASSRKRGVTLNIDTARVAMIKMLQKVDDLLINGWPEGPGSANGQLPVPGLITEDNINQISPSGTAQYWNGTNPTSQDAGPAVLKDVQNAAKVLQGDKYFGMYDLLINPTMDIGFSADYRGDYAKSVYARLNELSWLGNVIVVDALPENTAVLMAPRSDVFEVFVGASPMNVEMKYMPLNTDFMTFTAIAPVPKSTMANRSGICKINLS